MPGGKKARILKDMLYIFGETLGVFQCRAHFRLDLLRFFVRQHHQLPGGLRGGVVLHIGGHGGAHLLAAVHGVLLDAVYAPQGNKAEGDERQHAHPEQQEQDPPADVQPFRHHDSGRSIVK